MAGLFGHTWTSQYGAAPDGIGGDTWAVALGGLHGWQLAQGLQATMMLGGEWPPSAPRFRALCLGIPEFASMRLNLRAEHAERAPFSILVWRFIDSYSYGKGARERDERLLRDAYDEARAHVMAGGALPEPAAAALEHTPRPFVPASPETVAKAMAEAAAIVGVDLARPNPISEAAQ